MQRQIIGSTWDRSNRNGLNSNFEFLFEGVSRMEQLNDKADNTLKEAERINRINNDTNERLDKIIADSGTSSTEVVDARGGHTVLSERLNALGDDISSSASSVNDRMKMDRQSYKRLYEKLGGNTSEDIFINSTNPERLEAYINHNGSFYQRWRFTQEDYVFDANYPELPGGDPFIIDVIHNARLWKSKTVNIEDESIIKDGDWIQSGTNMYSETTGDFLEMDFFGSELRINSIRAGNAGIARITIDGRSDLVNQIPLTNGEALLDMYGDGSSENTLLATGLDDKWHTVKIEVTGDKNSSSSGYRIYCYFLRFQHPPFTNGDMSIQGMDFETVSLPDGGSTFRDGLSAIEFAINNTLNGNSVWSGSQHRNAYLKSSPEFYLDGDEMQLEQGVWQYGRELMIVQRITLVNGQTDIADVTITYTINKTGVVVSWEMEFLQTVNITNSYSAMYGTKANRIKFGGTNTTYEMVGDSSQKGDIKTDHAIGYHTDNDYLIFMEALNYLSNTRNHEDYDRGMFVWDRSKDAKLYIPNFTGEIGAGEKLESTFWLSIKHQNNVDKITI